MLRAAVLGVALSLLAGCSGGTDHSDAQPVAIAPGDMCAVCGMYITHYPGPRGEAYLRGRAAPLKFGSTRDFFAYITQPDVRNRLGAVYVQDTARIDWAHPSNAAGTFTDARQAYYVAWQPVAGAMGPTLASFAHSADARSFIAAHGGQLLRFDQVTPELISMLGYRCPGDNAAEPAGGHPGPPGPCAAKPGSVTTGKPASRAGERP